ncbi:hypothetical protein MWU54_01200 [Marivita sp. S6314]|uniref:hypothetical protein n=1 Tax=Marivita sp. S6314 TaxID=2926406 RepID=UPI001FF57291|nr:hypothetical protein [Marivita sp. S6314]MCK0148625.1 hypothetical protein [Marivita sp. S6314]
MRYAPKKTFAMITVLLTGLAVALAGFSGLVIPFGISIVLCFLVWIVGAWIVHVTFDTA